MTEKDKPIELETVSCDVCLTHIPESVAQTMEGGDYIQHYCGLECYKKWQETEES
ncbi:MAG: DUF3330 domain-containing protein, partial [Gammaproteobacteria bacterium]|nr:DUF3330 domain-containing protein [Gammaproteobacteria bacterium]